MFPFKLSTTSYIFPDHIIPNITALAPLMDEVELVLFESKGLNNLPDQQEIKTLMDFSLHGKVDFNIHFPIDIFLGDENEEVRTNGISMIRRVIENTLCLNPSVYILHFDLRNSRGQEEANIQAWRGRIISSAQEIIKSGMEPGRISIETLGYPFEWIEDIIKEFGFSICLDIGHILIYGQNLKLYFDKYLLSTSMIHLHGFQNGTDHLGIDKLNGETLDLILYHLQNYKGILSLEVFSWNELKSSLEILEEKWGKK